mmetsp:Transcript_14032/g.35363  ORF Transcript_14032/g.35363 Transcript_14032/m.35363 type:complete len:324 (-) Transcript_14032:291-1262(-)
MAAGSSGPLASAAGRAASVAGRAGATAGSLPPSTSTSLFTAGGGTTPSGVACACDIGGACEDDSCDWRSATASSAAFASSCSSCARSRMSRLAPCTTFRALAISTLLCCAGCRPLAAAASKIFATCSTVALATSSGLRRWALKSCRALAAPTPGMSVRATMSACTPLRTRPWNLASRSAKRPQPLPAPRMPSQNACTCPTTGPAVSWIAFSCVSVTSLRSMPPCQGVLQRLTISVKGTSSMRSKSTLAERNLRARCKVSRLLALACSVTAFRMSHISITFTSSSARPSALAARFCSSGIVRNTFTNTRTKNPSSWFLSPSGSP